jgi:hypothetical protein
VKNKSENKQTQYKWKTELQQGQGLLKRKSQHIPSHDNDKNSQLNADIVIERAENKKPKKAENDDEYGAKFYQDGIIHFSPEYF